MSSVAGMKAVTERYEEGRTTLANLISYIKDRVAIEEKYCRGLEKLNLKATWSEKGTLGESWGALKKWHEVIGKEHQTFMQLMHDELFTSLTNLKKDQETAKSTLSKDVAKLESGLEKSLEMLSKMRSKYVKACQDLEKTTLDLQKQTEANKAKEIEKLKPKLNTDKTTAQTALSQYQQQISEHHLYQKKYEEEMMQALQSFQELDIARLEAMKANFVAFSEGAKKLGVGYDESMSALVEGMGNVDPEADVQEWIEAHKTAQVPAELVSFEPFLSEKGVDVPGGGANPPVASPVAPADSPKEASENKKLKRSMSRSNKKDKVEKKDDDKPGDLKEKSKSKKTLEVEVAGTLTDVKKNVVARATFDYEAADETEISLKVNDIVTVVRGDGESGIPGWMEGIVQGKQGMFPSNYVELLKPLRKAVALFAFDATAEDELGFNEGEDIIIETELDGWFTGHVASKPTESGLFPANFVRLLDATPPNSPHKADGAKTNAPDEGESTKESEVAVEETATEPNVETPVEEPKKKKKSKKPAQEEPQAEPVAEAEEPAVEEAPPGSVKKKKKSKKTVEAEE